VRSPSRAFFVLSIPFLVQVEELVADMIVGGSSPCPFYEALSLCRTIPKHDVSFSLSWLKYGLPYLR
jgi:hypothetical protein